MYQNPALTAPPGPDGLPQSVDPNTLHEHFEVSIKFLNLTYFNFQDFYEDVFEELAYYGELENLNVCDNLADHMVGNVYAKFADEEAAAKALQALQGRFYAGRPILAEFSPVTDFREATCRQFEENTCARGGYCNFMHLKNISRELRKRLFGRYRRRQRTRSPHRRQKSRSPQRRRHRSGSRNRGRRRRSRTHSPAKKHSRYNTTSPLFY